MTVSESSLTSLEAQLVDAYTLAHVEAEVVLDLIREVRDSRNRLVDLDGTCPVHGLMLRPDVVKAACEAALASIEQSSDLEQWVRAALGAARESSDDMDWEYHPGFFHVEAGEPFVQSDVLAPSYVDGYIRQGGKVLKRLVGPWVAVESGDDVK